MLYLKVYNTIVNQIYSGKLKKGDRSPSIQAICSEYGVSSNTARTVLRLLHENELIDKAQRRPSIVTFDLSDPASQMNFSQMLSERRSVMLDAYLARSLILPSLIAASAERCQEEDLDEFDRLCVQAKNANGPESVEVAHLLFEKILSKLNNPLISAFLDMTDISMTVPLFIVFEREKKQMEQLAQLAYQEHRTTCELIRQRRYRELKKQVHTMYQITAEAVAKILDQMNPEGTPAFQPDLGLEEHLYLSIAFDLFEKILDRQYREREYLPSETALAQNYGVSVSTVKKAYRFLNDMQLTQTHNGKGTQVTFRHFAQRPQELVQKRMVPYIEGLFQAIQILNLTISDVSKYAVVNTNMPKEAIQNREEFFAKEQYISFLPLAVFDIVARFIQCSFLNNFYLLLKRNLLWGAYLLKGTPEDVHLYVEMCSDAVQNMDQPEQFAEKMVQICRALFTGMQENCRNARLPFPEII